jgi:predicted enzyme related to lactoylglutathione lyase
MANPFIHIELSSVDLKKAERFYKSIFGWKLQSVPEMGYTMIDVGGGTGGGMQTQRQPGAPSAWLPYVEVDSVKETLAKASKAGAKVMLDYMEIGGGMGAMGIFADPTGATIGVWEKGKAAPSQPVKAAKKAAKRAAEAVKKAAKAVKNTAKAAEKAVKQAAKKAAKPAKKAAKPAKKAK